MSRLFPAAGSIAFIVALAGSAQSPVASAQAPAKPFKLRWFGQSFFQLETPSGKKIVFDPHAIPQFGRPVVTADIILISHLHNDHAQPEVIENYKSARTFFGLKEVAKVKAPDWVKIDEKVGAIRIRTLGTYHDAENGLKSGKNSAFIVEAEGLTFCHLGDLGHELSPDQVKAIGKIDVLMIPVGGIYTINGETAKKVMGELKPRLFVVPMHYGVPGYDDLLPVDEFLEGQANVKKMPATNELIISADIKVDAPTVAVLSPKPPESPVNPKK
jgi:L-ascorbate metabolism protein UlaG (beta-lactamase superfamily)